MSNSLADLDRFRSDSFEPLSFRERGATIPFTTPLLLNARIRNSAAGRGFEMVISNPSGGRGALILPWAAMPDICSCTLFDRHLWESLAKRTDISPIGIRLEAQRLAAMGLAGRQAALAAKDAQQRETTSQRLMRSMLLESLIFATEAPNETAGRTNNGETEAFLKRAERAVSRAAAIAGVPLAEFTADLEDLAITLSGATPEMDGEDARLRHMIVELERMANDITDWVGDQQPEAAHVMAANFVVASARQTLECAEYALSDTDSLIADLGLLVPKWKSEKDRIIERARGPDWVLDGWKTPMALWQGAAPNLRRTAIWEAALIAPILPREAKAWLGAVSDWRDTPRRITQVVRDKSDWISGNMMELVARNENLIGFSIAYENQISPLVLPRSKTNLSPQKAETETAKRDIIPKSRSANNKMIAERAEKNAQGFTTTRNALSETRALGGMILTSSDQALGKIVELVDRLSNSEIHTRLLGPSLPRLKRLRPPRPASLTRMLCLPLAGALVDPLQWRRAEGRIPRSAILPLVESLTRLLGPQIDGLATQLRGHSLEDEKIVDRIGRQLWQQAASAAPRLEHDASWARAGLAQPDLKAIADLAGALWRHAGPLWDGMQQVTGNCPPEVLRAALIGPALESQHVFVAAFDTLLQRAERPSNFISLMKDLPAPVLPLLEVILNKWVGATLPGLVEEDFATSSRLAHEIGSVIRALEDLPRITAKTDATELVAHRRNLDQFCRNCYREVVTVHIIGTIINLTEDDAQGIDEIEGMARIARSLENAGRRFGSPKPYEDLQKEFRDQMENRQMEPTRYRLAAMQVARIDEILIGRDSAEKFLSRADRQGLRNR
jgi:hypothetical protein